jgi:transposase
MGPLSAKSFPGHELLILRNSTGEANPDAPRAKQEIDYGRRGKGYIFSALQPASGEVVTHCYPGRTAIAWIDFLHRVDATIPASCKHVIAIVDNLNTHSCSEVLLFMIGHSRWEFVFQPKYAAYLNLIEPWWKILKSLAFAGRRFESWTDIVPAVEKATEYWNQHRHPFRWNRRRRHYHRRAPGVAAVPGVRGLTG